MCQKNYFMGPEAPQTLTSRRETRREVREKAAWSLMSSCRFLKRCAAMTGVFGTAFFRIVKIADPSCYAPPRGRW